MLVSERREHPVRVADLVLVGRRRDDRPQRLGGELAEVSMEPERLFAAGAGWVLRWMDRWRPARGRAYRPADASRVIGESTAASAGLLLP